MRYQFVESPWFEVERDKGVTCNDKDCLAPVFYCIVDSLTPPTNVAENDYLLTGTTPDWRPASCDAHFGLPLIAYGWCRTPRHLCYITGESQLCFLSQT